MIVRNEDEMLKLGAQLADECRPGMLITLDGPVGAGKTVLSKGIVAALGFEGEVSSPTYAIVHEYDEPGMRLPVVHADLYRLDTPDELKELGLFDHRDSVVLVEWPCKGGTALQLADLAITIIPQPDGTRELVIEEKRKFI